MIATFPLNKAQHRQNGLSSVCINGDRVYGAFADEWQATAVALSLKQKCHSANVTIFDENSGVHFCVGLPSETHPEPERH
jgi:hypothetical protein